MINKIYYVHSDQDPTALVAMDVRVDENQKTISWLDTVKERLMAFKQVEYKADDFMVTTNDDREYFFQPMTLLVYNEKVKDKLIAGKNFETEEDMIRAFEETKGNIW